MIRALIAEDSAVTREYLRWLIDEAEGLEVAGVARNGEEAVELAAQLRPDVILMDVHMPQMDGFQATRLIMERHPTPIVMATASSSKAETRGAFEALDAGALVLLDKPPAPWADGHDEAAAELIRAMKLMAEVKVVRRWAARPTPTQPPPRFPRVRAPRAIAIGASTGGPQVISEILAALPAPLGVPLLLVQHISDGFIEGFVEWLGTRTPMDVVLAERGDELRPGTIFVAGSDRHLGIEGDGRLSFDGGPPINGFRPSISHLFDSVATCCGRESVGILLTGMGRDGADGLRRMREAGALTIAQDEASSVIFGMPGEAVRLDAAVEVLAPDRIAAQLWALESESVR
jgi:two-component system chemotaxis response regulator CheB